ncbi:ABC-type dipeptide/oligopeptide/nickel transport system ATPase component [Sinorhizobium fredii]
MSALLTVEDLRVRFPTRTGVVEAVRGVSFTLGRERLGIVGESGSGKSQTGRAVMGLTPAHAQVTAKRLAFDGIDLLSAPPKLRRDLRGKRIAMILQDPKYSLNPVMSIGKQIVETLQRLRRSAVRKHASGPSTCWRPCRSAIRPASSISTRTRFRAAWASGR